MTGGEQTIFRGRGACRELGPVLAEHSPRKIFLVTGRASYRVSGARDAIEPAMAGWAFTRYSDFGGNLKLEEIVEGVHRFRTDECDFVIGIGGGSVIDLAKAVAILGPQPDEPDACVTGGKTPKAAPVRSVMIPTTAGTGSESTHFSVLYVDGLKQSLSRPVMLPDYAVIDPSLTDSLPAGVTARSGMDALCQGIESYWSVLSTEESRRLSAEAIKLCRANLSRAVNDPDEAVRDLMLEAANLSGRAINIARTTAAHAASYPLTSRFGITHGHAVALFLPYLFEENVVVDEATLQDGRGIEFVRAVMRELYGILEVDSAAEARRSLLELMAEVGLETRLSNLGVTRDDLPLIAREGAASTRAGNNPVRIDENRLLSIWQDVF